MGAAATAVRERKQAVLLAGQPVVPSPVRCEWIKCIEDHSSDEFIRLRRLLSCTYMYALVTLGRGGDQRVRARQGSFPCVGERAVPVLLFRRSHGVRTCRSKYLHSRRFFCSHC